MRYVRQQDDYSCSPVAILNTLKWLGRKVSYKNLHAIKRLCNCTKEGTDDNGIEEALHLLNIKYEYRNELNVFSIVRHLEKGGIVLINGYCERNEGWHSFLCVDYDNRYFYTINEKRNETTTRRTWRKFTQDLTIDDHHADGWFISK